MQLSPIILFVYNRPEHSLKTLQALKKNVLANESLLIIYADGPKEDATPTDTEQIQKTREVIRQEQWCKEVKIIEATHNRGLATSIVEGVTDTVNQYGKVIVLEDDIVTSPGFLKYMNDALNLYENEDRVMHISGYFFPVKKFEDLPDTFFYNQASCWGWATWSRAWKYLSMDASNMLDKIKKLKLEYQFNIENSYPFIEHLEANASGKMKTWAIKWHASIFLRNGLCLHPKLSLVKNIGFDGSGIHCGVNDKMHMQPIAANIIVETIPLKESKLARKKVKEYNLSNPTKKKLLIARIKSYIWKKLRAH